MDPLSDILSLLKPRSYGCGGFDMGDIAIHFPPHEGIKCYAVIYGQAWLLMDGVTDPVHLKTGDCFVLPRGFPFCLTSDPALPPVDYRTAIANRPAGTVASINGGGKCLIIGGHFALDGRHAGILLGVLSPIVHLSVESDKATLRWALDRMMQELREPQPGGLLVIEHLAQMVLVQALRLHIAAGQAGHVGWLFALADKQIGPTIGAMHADPAQRWTLQSLAERAAMSRTSFALRFKATVGMPPMEYLTRWRMMVAGDRLMNSRDPISTIARSLGYDSESAFSTAFKRVMHCSPRQYGRGQTLSASAPVERETAGAPAMAPDQESRSSSISDSPQASARYREA